MAQHTIYTRPVDGEWIRVECACGEAIGSFTDTLIGRALATSAKTAHRLAVEPGRDPSICPDYETTAQTLGVLERVAAERQRQLEKWGHQRHDDGTNPANDGWRDHARTLCQKAAAEGRVTWAHILQEEFTEALAEVDPVKLVAELVQVMAVCAAWVEDIESR